jgi:beta-lactam-binding protein with PASTA domain
MRTDLIRVHSGQTPDAPKVFTDAERADLLTSASTRERRHLTGFAHGHRPAGDAVWGGTVRRWLLPAAAIIVLVVVGIVAVNAFTDRTHPVRVPDLHGKELQNAVATLQNLGFKIRGPIERADAAVPLGEVIGTDPGADTSLAGGDEVTINVSSGPEQRRVPDCSTLAVDDCVRRLADAGFDHPKPSATPSPTVPEQTVVATVPAAGQLATVSDEITIEVSSGPETRRVPDLSGQTVDQATTNLKIAGFPIVVTAEVDGLLPRGQVVATDPPAGTDLSVRSAVTLKVSRGNQFPMPSLIDKTYVEAMQILQGYGYVGQPINGGDVPGPDTNKFRVVKQDPPAGVGVNRDGTITLYYGS